jgi:hypothetical protein
VSSVKSIPPRSLPRVAWLRILREIQTRTAPKKPPPITVAGSAQQLAARIRERQRPRFFGVIPEQAALIAHFYPEAHRLILEQADAICRHEFYLLGSGPTELGEKIDWHIDFKSGHRWPLVHYTRLKLTDPKGGFDVKVPWELSRFHHVVRLGQAYLLTRRERYAQEIVAQIANWIGYNPYGFGIHWACSMEVAIRAVNWLWAYYCILESRALTERFLALWLTSLCQHGEHLVNHLEDGWPRTNHLIGDLVGLAYLGILLPEFREAERWREVGLERLWTEIERQTTIDGVDYEASTSYHRLVTEMALSVVALCLVNGIDVPENVTARLRAMLDVVMAYTQPNGMAPLIGDADDGRLHPLGVCADAVQAVQDHRHLLALGSLVLERELKEWTGYIDPTEKGWSVAAGDAWQDAFWCFPSDAAARLTDVLTRTTRREEGADPEEWVTVKPGIRVRAQTLARTPITVADVTRSQAFKVGGWFILRDGPLHMTVDAGSVGQGGAGGHAHNDTLSITLYAYDKPFLTDPGTYVYTANLKQRNLFRSTAYHNVLQVDGKEINAYPKGEAFRMSSDAKVIVHRWLSEDDYDFLDGSHDGFAPIIHRRQIWFDKSTGLWVLRDLVSGKGEHEIAIYFHFAPMPVKVDSEHGIVQTAAKVGANLTIAPLGRWPLKAAIGKGWLSPRYGVRGRALVAKFTGRVKLPAEFVLALYPHEGPIDLNEIQRKGRAALIRLRRAAVGADVSGTP